MLYFLYEWLSRGGHEHVPVLNLLKYLTFRTGMSMLTAYIVAVAMGSRFIRWMKAKQGKGQPIRTDGIARHVTEKAGTPTMGGFMILAGLFVGSLLFGDLKNVHVWVVLGITAAFVLIGIAFGRAMTAFRWVRDHYTVIRIASGLILVALGLLLFFNRDWWLNTLMNRALSAIGLDQL